MTELAGQEDRLPRRALDPSDSDFIARRPQFDAWGGSEPAPRRGAMAARPSRKAIRNEILDKAQALARSAGFGQVSSRRFNAAIAGMNSENQQAYRNGTELAEQLHVRNQVNSRDSRFLEPSSTLDFDDSSRFSRDHMKALRAVARMNEQPIAEDAQGEGAEAREFARNVSAYRRHVSDRRFGEWKSEERAQREQRASAFSWLSPSTWGIFKNFGWARKANARRQIAELEGSMGGTAPKRGPWRSGRYRPGATDANLFTDSAYSLTPQEYRAWGKAVPWATRYEDATTAKDQQAGHRGIMAAAESEGIDGGDLGRLALGAAVKSPEEKRADEERLKRAIDRDPAGDFSYRTGQAVGGHALLGAPTPDEDIPNIVRDVFGMDDEGSTGESPPHGSDAASDDDDATTPTDAPVPSAFQLRRAGRIAE